MYDYHSARNMVQLIGLIKVDPKEYEFKAGTIVRFVIEVCDRDDDFRAFHSRHIIIVPKDIEKRCTRGGVKKYDTVLVKGRLVNHKDEKTGKIISNVQAHEILCLRKYQDPAAENSAEEKGSDHLKMLNSPEYQEAKKAGKVVSLILKKCEDKYADDDEILDYEDEDEFPF